MGNVSSRASHVETRLMISSLALLAFALPGAGDTVPATVVGPYLQVRAFVNGTPLNLIVDTGAGMTVLTPRTAKAASVNGGVPIRAVGASGNGVSATLAKADTIQIGNSVVKGEQVVILELPGELDCDGLVGYSFLRHFATSFDYAQPSLTFAPSAAFRPHPDDEAFEMELKSNHPHVRGTVVGQEGTFLIDTGSSGTLTLYKPFVDAGEIRTKFPPRMSRISGKGVGGFVKGDITQLPAFQLGKFTLSSVPSVLGVHASDGESKGNAGAIGASIIRKFVMTLDYSARKVYFRKSSFFAEAYDVDRSGVFLSVEAGKFTVVEVVTGSPAATAGLKTGDVLVTVNGTAVSTLHPLKVKTAFRGPAGSRVKVTVLREGKRVDAEITLRDL